MRPRWLCVCVYVRVGWCVRPYGLLPLLICSHFNVWKQVFHVMSAFFSSCYWFPLFPLSGKATLSNHRENRMSFFVWVTASFFFAPCSPGVLVDGCGLFVSSRTINAYLWFVFVFFSRWRSFPWCLNAPCLWNQRLLLWVSLLEAHGATGGLSMMVHCWGIFL